jgi:hypothetical protein
VCLLGALERQKQQLGIGFPDCRYELAGAGCLHPFQPTHGVVIAQDAVEVVVFAREARSPSVA